MSLIQMSVLGAVMITVIVIIRALALNRLPKMTFCVLWWIVTVRLFVPYSLPCELSVYSILAPHRQVPEVMETGLAPIVYNIGSVNTANITVSPELISSGTAPFLSLRTIIWIVGMLITGSYFAFSYFVWRKRFAESLPVENDFLRNWLEDHQILRPLSIRVYDRISSPLTYGLFRPVILMPKQTDWSDTNTLKYVLTHEYVHIRRFDAVFKLLLTVSVCVHWFNPMVWVMYIIANRDIELSCDEKVVRILGGGKSSYAMALIQMEEQKVGSYPFSNSFSRNALKERIIAIMKFTKITPIAAVAATCLVAGTTAVFATNTAPDIANYNSLYSGTASSDMTIPSNETVYNSPNVEWWTYDEYAEWLEQEKANLESMIGQKAWTNTRGDFVWSREIVDETIALYEKILQDIKNGVRVSKTVDGSNDVMLASGIGESPATSFDFEEYTKYGLSWDKATNILYYNGQRVRYFFDGVDMGNDGMAIKIEYADSEKKGDVDVHTIRERIDNGDGSYDPMGPLTGLAIYSDEEFNARKFIPSILSAVTYGDEVSASDNVYLGEYVTENTDVEQGYSSDIISQEATIVNGTGGGRTFEDVFSKYKPYGISYVEAPNASGAGNIYYNGELVHLFSDITPSGGAFSFTSSKQGGINVRTVYRNNELSGVEIVT